jgi:hypothetical protein
MQISNVLSGFTDAAKLGGKKAENAAESLLKILKPGDATAQTSSSSKAALNEIIKQYDVTDITPADFSKMISKLHEAGAITDQEFQELSSIRTELESEGLDSDHSVNLVELYGDKVKKLQLTGETSVPDKQKLAPAMHKLDWLQKFSLLHANPESTGIDMAA